MMWNTDDESPHDAVSSCLLLSYCRKSSSIPNPQTTLFYAFLLAWVKKICTHTTCSNIRLVLLKMGIMMPETCWEIVKNKHLTVASCWFSLSLHNQNLLPCKLIFGGFVRGALIIVAWRNTWLKKLKSCDLNWNKMWHRIQVK